ncbi:hypothetical protein ACLOJK_022853 [Asimina triloba]
MRYLVSNGSDEGLVPGHEGDEEGCEEYQREDIRRNCEGKLDCHGEELTEGERDDWSKRSKTQDNFSETFLFLFSLTRSASNITEGSVALVKKTNLKQTYHNTAVTLIWMTQHPYKTKTGGRQRAESKWMTQHPFKQNRWPTKGRKQINGVQMAHVKQKLWPTEADNFIQAYSNRRTVAKASGPGSSEPSGLDGGFGSGLGLLRASAAARIKSSWYCSIHRISLLAILVHTGCAGSKGYSACMMAGGTELILWRKHKRVNKLKGDEEGCEEYQREDIRRNCEGKLDYHGEELTEGERDDWSKRSKTQDNFSETFLFLFSLTRSAPNITEGSVALVKRTNLKQTYHNTAVTLIWMTQHPYKTKTGGRQRAESKWMTQHPFKQNRWPTKGRKQINGVQMAHRLTTLYKHTVIGGLLQRRLLCGLPGCWA